MLLAVVTLDSIEKVFTFLVMLSILVVLHEYGHFLVARRTGVRVNEFAVGMGPKLFGWTSPRSRTLYSFRALPIGGYCAMEGEDNKTSEAEQQREFLAAKDGAPLSDVNFQAKTPLQRLAIVLAGPVANFILAFIILLVGAVAFGAPSDSISPVVMQVLPGSPASRAGVQSGDRIISIDGTRVTSGAKVVDIFHASLGKVLTVVFERNGLNRSLRLKPEACPKRTGADKGCIGIYPATAYERVSFPDAVRYTFLQYGNIAENVVGGIVVLFTHFKSNAGNLMGPIGLGQAATVVQDWGWGPYFGFAAMISFALGLFNLLPLPALDGGRAAFIVAELLRGKPVDPEKEAMVHIAGFMALMALMALIAFHDIERIISGKGIL